MASFSASEFNRKLRQAQQQAEREMKRRIEAAYQKIQAEIRAENRKIEAHNRRADTHNQKVINEINRRLASASRPEVVVRYTPAEQELVDRVHAALPVDDRPYHLFCSYAHIDGAAVTDELHAQLTALGLDVWRDTAELKPGQSMARQLDNGLGRARAGVVVLTPAYLTGRFWTERELGALLHKDTVIPVLHNVTYADVKKYSAFLGDMFGFNTAEDSIAEIAIKIASAVIGPEAIDPAA